MEIELSDAVTAKVDVKHAILGGGTNRHGIAIKRFANMNDMSTELNEAFSRNTSNDIDRVILNGRQGVGKSPGADLVATGRNGHAQGLMGPLIVVHMSVGVELLLNVHQITEALPLQQV